MSRMRLLALWLALLAGGCSDETTEVPPIEGTGGAAGAPGCPVGSVEEGDACIAAGVKSCAPGFESNGRGGCRAVLPADPCGPGYVALPGETRCRHVGDDCGEAPWGLIPVNETTQYVDANYPGTDSDGSAAKPWKTIQLAVNAATDLVAITDGIYPESLLFGGKSLRLWGRCPERVTIASDRMWEAVILDASGNEVHNLALSGPTAVGAYYSGDTLLEDVWIHDTALEGVLAIGDSLNGPTQLTVRDSLIENVAGIALALVQVDGSVERTVVRDIGGSGEMGAGRGIHLERDLSIAEEPSLVVTSSIVERALEIGIVAEGVGLTVEASLVRDIAPAPSGRHGAGIAVQNTSLAGAIRDSVIERTIAFGVILARAEATVTSSTVETVAVQDLDGEFGDGMVAAGDMTLLTIEDSRIASAARAGVSCFSAAVSVRGTALECNTFHLDGEGAFTFDNAGQNACWCLDEAVDCKVLSAGISPPAVLR
jgi:hypothetical protein